MDGIDLSRLARKTDWRAILREWAHAVRRRQQEVPYGVEIMQVRAQVPTRWLELCVAGGWCAAFRRAGRRALFNTVVMFQRVVSGSLLTEFSLATAQPDTGKDTAAHARSLTCRNRRARYGSRWRLNCASVITTPCST